MKFLGVIPARYGSSRFPGKPLIDLKGKTMIQRVYEGASLCESFSKVVVATDDERIFEHVNEFGGEALMTSTTHHTGTDRCGEVALKLPGFDAVINIQGDEPLVQASQLEALCMHLKNPHVQIATLAIQNEMSEAFQNTNRVKLVMDHNHKALYFSRSNIPNHSHQRDQIKPQTFWRHIGLYGYRTEVLQKLVHLPECQLEILENLEQLRWMYHGYSIHIVETTLETPNIDSPEDVDLVLSQL